MNKVQKRVAIVTGGSLGIGHTVCIHRVEEGAIVVITDRLDAEGNTLAREIAFRGGTALIGIWTHLTSNGSNR